LQDIGITGLDWIRETHADVEILQNLEYGKVRVNVAIPKCWNKINSLSRLMETLWSRRKGVRISTEYLNITTEYVKNNPSYRKLFGNSEPLVVTPWWRKGENPRVSVFLSFGATEAKPPEDADAIVDVTETGATLEQNNLKAIETIIESTAVLIANKKSLTSPQKKEKIYDILTLLKGVVDGTKRLHIFVNVRKENLPKLLKKLTALKKPTIAPLSDKSWYSVNTVIEKDLFLKLLPAIRRLAQGLVVYEPRQVLTLDEINWREKK
jgi:ATP phosphoribosyltransferase